MQDSHHMDQVAVVLQPSAKTWKVLDSFWNLTCFSVLFSVRVYVFVDLIEFFHFPLRLEGEGFLIGRISLIVALMYVDFHILVFMLAMDL